MATRELRVTTSVMRRLLASLILLVLAPMVLGRPAPALAERDRIAVWRLVGSQTYSDPLFWEFESKRCTVTATDQSMTCYYSLDTSEGSHSEYVRHVEWESPPEVIQVGSENLITLDVTLAIDDILYTDREGNVLSTASVLPIVSCGASVAWGTFQSTAPIPEEYQGDPDLFSDYQVEDLGYYRWAGWSWESCWVLTPNGEVDPWGSSIHHLSPDGLANVRESYVLSRQQRGNGYDLEDQELLQQVARGAIEPGDLNDGCDRFGLMIGIGSTNHTGLVHVYFYELDPDGSAAEVVPTELEVDTDASEQAGETSVPVPAVIAAMVATTAAGAAVVLRKKGRRGGVEERRDRKEPPSTFRMVLYKDFGDTLRVGEQPRGVGARIEELRHDGTVVPRPDLTAQISVEGSEAISATPWGLQAGYQTAGVQASDLGEAQLSEGTVSFTFVAPQGSFRNNVRFKISAEYEIVFAPEALTFIAGAHQTLQMPFGIKGLDPEIGLEPRFSLKLDVNGQKRFKNLRVVRDDKYPELWDVELTEESKPDDMPAGYMGEYSCELTATIPGARGDRQLRGSFDFYLFYEGILLSCQPLKAYCIEKDAPQDPEPPDEEEQAEVPDSGDQAPTVGDEFGPPQKKEAKKVLCIAHTKMRLTLYTWDKESGRLQNPISDLRSKDGVKISFTDVPGSEVLKDKDGNDVAKPCEALDFRYYVTDILEGNNTICYDIVPTKGVMLPPNRSQADVEASVTWGGRTFTAKERVNVLSQPRRQDLDERYSFYRAQDDDKFERLSRIRYKILTDPTYEDLMPVYYRIEAMIDGYDIEYGFFEHDYRRVSSLFARYTTGALGSIEANQLAFYGTDMFYADAFKAVVQGLNRSIPLIALRVGCAFVSKGLSEAFFIPASAISMGTEASLNYVDSGGDSLLEAYRVGVSEASRQALKDVLLNLAFEYGAEKIAPHAKALSKKAVDAKRALSAKLRGFFSSGKGAGAMKSAAKSVSGQLDDAARAAQGLIDSKRGLALTDPKLIRRDIAYTMGRIRGQIKYNDAMKALRRWDKLTRHHQQAVVLAVQGDKHAMRAMMEATDPMANLVRANHSRVMMDMEGRALHMARVSLADDLGRPLADIRVKTTSGNALADIRSGAKVSMDMDATFQVRVNDAWVDVKEALGQRCFDKAFHRIAKGFDVADDVAASYSKGLDLSIVDAVGRQSYGTYDDAMRVVKASRAGEAFDDPLRVAQTAQYKCDEWLEMAERANRDASRALARGDFELAQELSSCAESFTEEGCRSFSKQAERLVNNRLYALQAKGVKVDMGSFLKKAEVIRQSGLGKAGGTGLTTPEVEVVLKEGLGTSLKEAFHELGEWIVKLDAFIRKQGEGHGVLRGMRKAP